jgi:hypothetical protein
VPIRAFLASAHALVVTAITAARFRMHFLNARGVRGGKIRRKGVQLTSDGNNCPLRNHWMQRLVPSVVALTTTRTLFLSWSW